LIQGVKFSVHTDSRDKEASRKREAILNLNQLFVTTPSAANANLGSDVTFTSMKFNEAQKLCY
jgi:hypothetical protein